MAEPFWIRRALGLAGNPVISEMYLTDKKTGYPQTIYSQSHPLGLLPSAEAILYPTIRWRTPGLERLTDEQARNEAMRNNDYLRFPTLWDAEYFARNLSNKIKRKKK